MEDFLHWSEFVIGFFLVVGLILSDAMRIAEDREGNTSRRRVRKRSRSKESAEPSKTSNDYHYA